MRFKSFLFPWELAIDGILDSFTDYGSLLNYTVNLIKEKLENEN